MAQTPPCHLPNIPGVTSPSTLIEDSKVEVNNLNNLNNHDRKHAVGDDAQFEMDI
ncbi:Eukaryotic translation initiation factor 4E-binding protein 2 [Myotis davidii]|nr:Eukaryotic translation initiation factor 4E-binding protein 2 [Myotis davidii]